MGAIGAAYATVAEYKASTKKTSSGDEPQLDLDLISISRHIERRLGAVAVGFNQEASASTRYQRTVRGNDYTTLWLNVPLSIAPTSVIIDTDGDGDWADETALTLTEFSGDVIYHPLGGLLGNTEPITGIELTGNGTVNAAWPSGVVVQIIGKHGWPSVPEPIKSATIGLTEYLRLETARSTGQITSIDSVINASPKAIAIISELMMPYKAKGGIF